MWIRTVSGRIIWTEVKYTEQGLKILYDSGIESTIKQK